jgi:hypothetical protein
MKTQVWINDVLMNKPSHERRTSDGPCQIVITDTGKTRYFAGRSTFSDEWPTLYRRDVSALSDAEWFVSPGEGWRLAAERIE